MTDRPSKVVARLSPEIEQRLDHAGRRAGNVANRIAKSEIIGDEEATTLENFATRLETALSFVEHALSDCEAFAREHGK